ncbi:SHOCT domain-containing protein [Streptacidiphilus sp. ASG 303]|uniref:SHOCT domain-containing protein n=1 Tax=Streptacidiphilus sp. ASG 303 TaxID=2896847 RepID=UPI001E451144|nr:SHOCT domain-containing protein [Streptacidiphilus sp. ASG 303]MCD0484471.1 SHOCT domain-containing protein [Streptacidiphilus sp. ASG 303]
MPGLIRGVARTAVISGTATAVSNRVSRRQAGRWAQQEAAQQAPVQQAPAQEAPAPAPAAAPGPGGDPVSRKIDQLKELAELREQGVLTDAEFEAQKRAVLSG